MLRACPTESRHLKIFVLTTMNERSEIQGFRQSTLMNWTKALHPAEQLNFSSLLGLSIVPTNI